MKTPNEKELLEAAQRLLKTNEPDELVVARLRAARLRAIEAKRDSSTFSWRAISGSVATAGIVAAIAGVLWFKAPSSELPVPRSMDTTVADIDLLTTSDGPDFYTELDFYDWLAQEADAG